MTPGRMILARRRDADGPISCGRMVSTLPSDSDQPLADGGEREDRCHLERSHSDAEGSACARVRILIFNPSYPPVACGVGAYTRGLAQALVRAGHDVTVITGAASTTTTDGPPRVLPPLRNWGAREFLRAW